MTVTERKRALMIEKTSRIYGTMVSGNKMLAILTIGVLLFEVGFFAPGHYFFTVFMLHSLFMPLSTALVVIVNTHPIGPTGYIIEENVYVATPPNHPERFLCILPFEAKDLLNLYFTSFEKQLAVVTASTVLLQVLAEALRPLGYTVSGGYVGICCLAVILYEVLLIIILFTGIRTAFAILIIHAPMIPSIILFTYMNDLLDKDEVRAMEMFSHFNIFSGVPGIIIMIITAAAMILIGELCLRQKTGVSWNIRQTNT